MKLTHPTLDWRGPTPVAAAYSDIYYSPEDALGEVRHNFVSCVRPMMGERSVIVVGETGFGTGLNFLVTWHDWLRHRRAGDRLIFVSTEAHPLRVEDLQRALAPFSELKSQAEQLTQVWPVGIPGPHRRFFDVGEERGVVELWVLYGDALEELTHQNFQADAWYFDGFNPSENPALWSPELITECARLMAPGAMGGTFTVASAVRQSMGDAGLTVQKSPGFGRKRECLRIHKPGSYVQHASLNPILSHVKGDGIAAASLCYAAHQRGYSLTYGARTSPHRASGNPVALVNFKPTKAPHDPGNRMLASTLAHIQPIYAMLWLEGRGTHKPAKTEEELAEFQACCDAMGWSEDALMVNDLEGVGAGLFSPLAGHLRPADVVAYLSENSERADGLEDQDAIYALGYKTLAAAPSLDPNFRRNIGQVDVFEASKATNVPMPITYGGYISPEVSELVLAGSTYEREPDWENPGLWRPTQEATKEIVQKATKAGFSLPDQPEDSYVSARAFGKDHRPIVGQTKEGAWVLTGLGSRGFLTAPLLAEILLDEMEGREVAGLPTYDFKACVHPSRFEK